MRRRRGEPAGRGDAAMSSVISLLLPVLLLAPRGADAAALAPQAFGPSNDEYRQMAEEEMSAFESLALQDAMDRSPLRGMSLNGTNTTAASYDWDAEPEWAVPTADSAPLPTILEGSSEQAVNWMSMGCYRRMSNDGADVGKVDSVRDLYCGSTYDTSTGERCRSGLPFYRYVASDMTPGTCQGYCLGKGLDLCGVVASRECRCGATARVSAIWGRPPLDHLTFQPLEEKLPVGSGSCEIAVFKYVGERAEAKIPARFITRSLLDEGYIMDVGCPAGDCGNR
eukprot:TRINITY_DN74578_c0_g1_i1.p1 TRINITY_DN74578_c0_g1~~TRINITY_DN74578_c0_g1_i1.p1  ORF type:complete len:298 (-),score=56.50 TRINITY_DN74578_c0_g1_i1:96-941(-)